MAVMTTMEPWGPFTVPTVPNDAVPYPIQWPQTPQLMPILPTYYCDECVAWIGVAPSVLRGRVMCSRCIDAARAKAAKADDNEDGA